MFVWGMFVFISKLFDAVFFPESTNRTQIIRQFCLCICRIRGKGRVLSLSLAFVLSSPFQQMFNRDGRDRKKKREVIEASERQ